MLGLGTTDQYVLDSMSSNPESQVKLWLHLGSEKTGTSFLQCMTTANRDLLARCGIHFPYGTTHDERCMRSGRISAGNGRVLARKVAGADWRAVENWFAAATSDARKRGCKGLLVSSEELLAPLAMPGSFERFVEALTRSGVNDVSLLLVLRDPASQLLSLYKHRAKDGSVGRIADWVAEGYLLPKHLAALRRQLQSSDIKLLVRAYRRGSDGLERLFFRDWLELEGKMVDGASEVNPSLSLSELELVRLMHRRRPELVAVLHERLSAVSRTEKVQGRALECHARAVAEQTVRQHGEEWQRWNELLPEGERLEIPGSTPEIPPFPNELAFSGRQLDAIAGFLGETVTLKFLAQLIWRSRIRPGLGRVARAVGIRR